MVHVYITDITCLPDPQENPYIMDGLPAEQKDKILYYASPKGRKQCLGARLLQRHVLHLHGFAMEDVTYGEHSKPEAEGICFNISHSHDMAVCAVSAFPVGCDIEKIAKARENVAKRFFCKNEAEYLNQFEGEQKDLEFFRLWTMKESYMKMTGDGMHLPMDQFEFVLDEPLRVVRNGEICDCFVKEYGIPGYKLTVCAEENVFSENVIYVNL